MWDELSTGIMNLLKTLATVDVADGVALFDYGKTKMDAYPTITVTPSDNIAVFADTQRQQRSYIFAIRCYQERIITVQTGQNGEQHSEAIMRQLVDSIITLFDANLYLDQVNGFGRLAGRGYCKPIPSVWKYVGAEQIDVRMAEILLECVVIQ